MGGVDSPDTGTQVDGKRSAELSTNLMAGSVPEGKFNPNKITEGFLIEGKIHSSPFTNF